MKSSKYNIFVDFPENQMRLAYNSYSQALVEFALKDRPIIEKILNDPDDILMPNRKHKKIKGTLVKGGFLIDDSLNEMGILKAKNRIDRFVQDNHLGLTIAPTLDCNFRCVYCYEEHRKNRMDLKTQKALLRWVEPQTSTDKNLSVCWFGGEPLLVKDAIEYLSKGFLRFAKKNDAQYSAFIITNGYLLDRETAHFLKKYGVTGAQITIDGPKEIHDRRRPLANGRGTFETVFNNVRNCCDILSIHLRINVDKENVGHINKILDILEKQGLKNKVHPYIGHVYPYTEACADIQQSCFRKEEFGILEARLKLQMLRRGFSHSRFPHLKGGFCTADSYDSATITPSGAMVKCWNDICSEDESVGHLLSKKITLGMSTNFYKWMAWDPFEMKECRECQILPICMGGCPYIALKEGLKDRGDCMEWKYNLKEMLSLYYLQKKKREEIEIANALIKRVEKLRKDIKKEHKDQVTA